MAAVVASLAAFVAGCGLPVPEIDALRRQLADASVAAEAADVLFETRHDEGERKQVAPRGARPAAKGEEHGVALANSQEASGHRYRGRQCQKVLQDLQDDLQLPTFSAARGSSPDNTNDMKELLQQFEVGDTISPMVRASFSEDFAERAPGSGGRRRVRFDLGAKTLHEITPYSEVYGMHPRDFHFGRKGTYLIRGEDFGSDSDEEDEDGWTEGLRRRISRRLLPWPVWGVACVMFLMLRAFGLQACAELLYIL